MYLLLIDESKSLIDVVTLIYLCKRKFFNFNYTSNYVDAFNNEGEIERLLFRSVHIVDWRKAGSCT